MTSRSGALLRSAMDAGELTLEDLTRELALSHADCALCVSGDRVLSLPHQLALAALLIERVPRLRRRAYALRGQAAAAVAFSSGETETHSSAPTKWRAIK